MRMALERLYDLQARARKGYLTPKLPDITKEELLAAIRDGVYDAMWQMITNATSMPCNDLLTHGQGTLSPRASRKHPTAGVP